MDAEVFIVGSLGGSGPSPAKGRLKVNSVAKWHCVMAMSDRAQGELRGEAAEWWRDDSPLG
jgi:hypothetical protein